MATAEEYRQKLGFTQPQNAQQYRGALQTTSPLTDIGLQLTHGLARGAADVIGLPGTLGELMGQGIDWATGAQRTPEQEAALKRVTRASVGLPTGQQVQEAVLPPRPEPQTGVGKFVGNVAPYAAGALIPAGTGGNLGRLAAQAGYGLAGGAATEAVRASDLPEPYKTPTAIAAGFAPAVLGGVASFIKGQQPASAMTREALKGLTPDEFAKAQALEQAGKEFGIPLMGAESLAGPVGARSPITRLAGDIAATPSGAPAISQMAQARPEQIQQALGRELAKIGPLQTSDEVLKGVHDAARTVIGNVVKARSDATGPLFKAAGKINIPPGATAGVIDQVDQALAAAGRGTPLATRLTKLRKQLVTANGQPETLTSRLQGVYQNLRDDLAKPDVYAAGSLRSYAGILRPLTGALGDALEQNNPTYARAMTAFRQISPGVEVVTGTAELPSLIKQFADAEDVGQLRGLLSPDTLTPEMIQDLTGAFRASGRPDAFRGFLRFYLETAADRASKDIQSGKNVFSGANFRNAVAGTPKQRANLQAAFDAVDPEGAAGRGFFRLLDVLAATGKVPGIGSPTASRMAVQQSLGGETLGAAAALGAGAAAGIAGHGVPAAGMTGVATYKITNMLKALQTAAGAKTLANALTAPNSVNKLRALARMDPGTPKARAIAFALLGGMTDKEQEQ